MIKFIAQSVIFLVMAAVGSYAATATLLDEEYDNNQKVIENHLEQVEKAVSKNDH